MRFDGKTRKLARFDGIWKWSRACSAHPSRPAGRTGRRPCGRVACARTLSLVALAFLLLPGCGSDSTGPQSKDEIAVFGYLYVNETMGGGNAIYITRTRPIDEVYDAEEAAVSNALVTLQREGAGGPDTLSMIDPGLYANPRIRIGPGQTYHLSVEIPGRPIITATTTTPDSFAVLHGPIADPDSMIQSTIAESYPIVLTCPNEEQIFLVDVFCREEWQDARYVIRFGSEDGPRDFAEYGGASGPPRHLLAYFRIKDIEHEDLDGPDGPMPVAYRITWYGDMMAFYGRQQVGVFSIDGNYYNYLYRDHPELNGGIAGGIGVFASACRKQYLVNVTE